MPDFAGRTGAALVVGGSGGLGAPIARLLADRAGFVSGQKLDVDGGYGA